MSEEQSSPLVDGRVIIQFINYLLHFETILPVIEYQIDDSYFPGYEQEFNYVINFYNESKIHDSIGKVPDLVKFSSNFPEFPLYQPVDAVNTLYRELLEQKCYSIFVEKILQAGADRTREGSSFDAISYVKKEIDDLYQFANKTLGDGKDLIKGSKERLEDYIRRIEVHGMLGISSGDKYFDKILHGWLPEDLIILMARTNQGKSWILLYYLLQAVLSGNKVALYSGEMSHLMMGFRLDTLYKSFSNTGLIGGDPNLGDSTNPDVGSKSMKEYQQYIDALLIGDLPEFKIYTQRDIGGRISINKMRVLQERHGFALWGADQLSLMDDDKKGREERIRFGNITSDARVFTQDYQIPTIIAHQAGRKAAESKKKDPNATPELEDSFGADAVMQNATRGISFTQIENGAKIKLVKNTYGLNGSEFQYIWNINHGIYRPIDQGAVKDMF